MSRRMLHPQGDFPAAGLTRRLLAMLYDFLLCVALVMVVTLAYQQGLLRLIYGGEHLMAMSQAGALDRDPMLGSLALLSLFAFFSFFWIRTGQTLGMQVWGLRVQNANGSAIDLWQALLRFLIAIPSWLICGLGFIWMLWDKQRRSWHDIYSESRIVQLPKNAHKK